MNIEVGKKALVTTDNWFFAPNGQSYRAVFGTVKAIHTTESIFGFTPTGKSTNWFLEIGNMLIAGCQIHYALRTDVCSDAPAPTWSSDASNGLKEYNAPSRIYFADADDMEFISNRPLPTTEELIAKGIILPPVDFSPAKPPEEE
jgi:hypothetical protein